MNLIPFGIFPHATVDSSLSIPLISHPTHLNDGDLYPQAIKERSKLHTYHPTADDESQRLGPVPYCQCLTMRVSKGHLIHSGIDGINVSEPVQAINYHIHTFRRHRTWFLSAIETSPFTTVTWPGNQLPLDTPAPVSLQLSAYVPQFGQVRRHFRHMTAYLDAWRALSYVFCRIQ